MAKPLLPQSEEQLAEIVTDHARSQTPLAITGGGTHPIGNPLPQTAQPVSVSNISGITLYEPGALTLVAKAGTPIADVEAALDQENQHLPFEPADYRGLFGTQGEPTIGGMTAAAVSGPRRIQVGACRDSLIGVRFVSGEGEMIKNGGRVMKNVTGYDLVKLLCGSFGTLGILTEVSFKLLPKPETSASIVLHGLDAQHAFDAMACALGSPFDVNGAAHLPGETAQTLLRVEGLANAVSYRTNALKERLSAFGDVSVLEDAQSRQAWKSIRDVEGFKGKVGDVWRISVKPGDGPKVVERMGDDVDTMMDWGGGLIWALAPPATDLRQRLSGIAGHATLYRADVPTKAKLGTFHPEQKRLAEISAGLRRQFDPAGIFNPGLMAEAPALVGA